MTIENEIMAMTEALKSIQTSLNDMAYPVIQENVYLKFSKEAQVLMQGNGELSNIFRQFHQSNWIGDCPPDIKVGDFITLMSHDFKIKEVGYVADQSQVTHRLIKCIILE